MAIYKNVASQKIGVYAYDPTVTPGTSPSKTGDAANITAEISLDGAASTATNDVNPTELDATDHPGIYLFDLTQAETNADLINISAVSATSNVLLDPVQVLTLPGDSTSLSANTVKLSGDSTAADNAELAFNGTGYGFTGCTMPTVTTLTGHTAQTGDSFARIGAAGASLTAVPWNSSWDTEVESECNDALVAIGLDHLVSASVSGADVTDNSIVAKLVSKSVTADFDDFVNMTDSLQALAEDTIKDQCDTALTDQGLDHLVFTSVTGTDVADNSIIARLVSASATADWDDFDQTTDSLQAIRDRGDAAWTGGGGSGLTALASGTAQGGTSSTIQLASASTFANDELNGCLVGIHTGTGAGQCRPITDYTGSTDTATVKPDWTTTPDNTSQYEVIPGPHMWDDDEKQEIRYRLQLDGTQSAPTTNAGTQLHSRADDIGSTAETQINAQVDTAITDAKLDALAGTGGINPTDNTILANLASRTGVWTTYDRDTMSAEGFFDTAVTAPTNWTSLQISAEGLLVGIVGPNQVLSTTISAVVSRTVFDLTAGSATDDAYNDMTCRIIDQDTATEIAEIKVSDYVGSSRRITIAEDPAAITDIEVGDKVFIIDDTGASGDGDWTMDERQQIRYRLQMDGSQSAPTTDDGTQLPTNATVSVAATVAATAVGRVSGTTLTAYNAESVLFSVAPLDSDGNAVDTTAMTLEVVIENRAGTDVETIANANITKTATTFSFTPAVATNTAPNQYKWSCRRTDTDVVIAHGPYIVERVAIGD